MIPPLCRFLCTASVASLSIFGVMRSPTYLLAKFPLACLLCTVLATMRCTDVCGTPRKRAVNCAEPNRLERLHCSLFVIRLASKITYSYCRWPKPQGKVFFCTVQERSLQTVAPTWLCRLRAARQVCAGLPFVHKTCQASKRVR